MHYTLIMYMLSFIVLFGNFYVNAYLEKVIYYYKVQLFYCNLFKHFSGFKSIFRNGYGLWTRCYFPRQCKNSSKWKRNQKIAIIYRSIETLMNFKLLEANSKKKIKNIIAIFRKKHQLISGLYTYYIYYLLTLFMF